LLIGNGAKVRLRIALSTVGSFPAAGTLATEEVAKGGAEGRGAIRATETSDRWARLGVRRFASVALLPVGTSILIFLIVIIFVDAEPEPSSDTL
jgi:hypothetical protein